MTWKHRFWPSKTLIFEVQNLRFLLKPAQTLQNLWLDSSCYFSTNSDVSKHDPKTTVFDPKNVFSDDSIQQPMDTIPSQRWCRPLKWSKTAFLGTFWWVPFRTSRSRYYSENDIWSKHDLKHCFYTETTTFIRFWQNPADTFNVATVVITCTNTHKTHVLCVLHVKTM